jgi:acetoin utilization deacetylase AcuC-like enzyme
VNSTPPGILITHPGYRQHFTAPGHPERPERLAAIESLLRRTPLWEALDHRDPEPAGSDLLTGVHPRAYIDRVRDLAASGGGFLDPDTPVSPASFETARLAAGGAALAVDVVTSGGASIAMALVRPPGHHAGPAAGRGFCIFNNVAIAARYAIAARGVRRVLIVDWDVHHGNGTQEIFYRDDRVLVCSLHQEHWYPGTGAIDEIGEGPGEGMTVNIPLPAGVGVEGYTHVWEEVVVPLAAAARPDLVMLSAGYDAHHADPLGGMLMTARGFGLLSASLRNATGETPIAAILEGGYDLNGLSYSVAATLESLTGIPAEVAEPDVALREVPYAVVRSRVREVRHIINPFWSL